MWLTHLDWFEHEGVDMPSSGWPSVFIEDFLQHTAEKSGGTTGLLTFYKLQWLVKRAKAPLCLEDVQPPVVATPGKVVAQQRPALEPGMVWELLREFRSRQQNRDRGIVQSAVAVISAFTPIRYTHVNRSVPLWRNDVVAVFWAFRHK